MDAWNSGGALQVCERGSTELWRRAKGVKTWNHGGMKFWEAHCRCGQPEGRYRRVDVEVWRSGGALQARRRGGMEV